MKIAKKHSKWGLCHHVLLKKDNCFDLLDFSSISNAIREDAEEAEDDEKQANPIKNNAADR